MRGIIKNINNPFIILSILFDYFKIKMNTYIFKGSLLSLLLSLYKDLNINGRYNICNTKRIKSLKTFLLGLNMAFGYTTQDQLRNCLANYITNDQVNLPNDGTTLYNRILSFGLGEEISNNLVKTTTLFTQVDKKLSITDKNEMRFLPIFTGIRNYLSDILNIQKKFDVQTQISEICRYLVQIDPESVFTKERNKILHLVTIGKVFNFGLKRLNDMDEVMYGSSSGHSSYDSPEFIKTLIPRTYDPVLRLFDEIESNSWKPPSEVSLEDK